jgi:hypothetical protein
MQVAADGDSRPAHFANLVRREDFLPRFDVDFGEMGIQSEQPIGVLDHDQVTIEIFPGTIDGFLIRSCENDGASGSGIDGRPALVWEFHPVMRLTLAIGCRAVAIRRVDAIVRGRLDRALQDEMTVCDAEI